MVLSKKLLIGCLIIVAGMSFYRGCWRSVPEVSQRPPSAIREVVIKSKVTTDAPDVEIKVSPIKVYETMDGEIKIDDKVPGTIKIKDEVFNIEIDLEASVRSLNGFPPLRLGYVVGTASRNLSVASQRALSLLYTVKLPVLSWEFNIGAGIGGYFVTKPYRITRNTSIEIGVGQTWKGQSQFVLGVSVGL